MIAPPYPIKLTNIWKCQCKLSLIIKVKSVFYIIQVFYFLQYVNFSFKSLKLFRRLVYDLVNCMKDLITPF